MGKLIANSDSSSQVPIGSNTAGWFNGTITINGGNITAAGSENCRAIGNISANYRCNIVINGGIVNATGGTDSEAFSDALTVNGGIVNATGGANAAAISGTLTVNKGGTVNATGMPALSCSCIFSDDIFAKAGDSEATAVYTANDQLDNKKYVHIGSIYTITWNNEDGTLLNTAKECEGDIPTADIIPDKTDDVQYTYTFAGWNDGTTTYAAGTDLPPVTADTTYTAVFSATVKTYTVTWLNFDGTVLGIDDAAYGTTPEYNGEIPAVSDDSYTHPLRLG